MIVNIWGASGSGKTTLIRNAIQAGVVYAWLRGLVDSPIEEFESPRIALATMPIPRFRGSVESYLNLYGITCQEVQGAPIEMLELCSTVFSYEDIGAIPKNMGRSVETLSAGEGRRLSLLRCLLENAELRIIDEPFANSNCDLNSMILSAINIKGSAMVLTHDAISNPRQNEIQLKVVAVDRAKECLEKVLNDC